MSQCRMAVNSHAVDSSCPSVPLRRRLTDVRHCYRPNAMSEQRMPGGVPELTLGWRMKMALGHDVTVQDMADELGMSRGQVSRYLNDKGIPRRAVLVAWALRCGVPFEWLSTGQEPAPAPDD